MAKTTKKTSSKGSKKSKSTKKADEVTPAVWASKIPQSAYAGLVKEVTAHYTVTKDGEEETKDVALTGRAAECLAIYAQKRLLELAEELLEIAGGTAKVAAHSKRARANQGDVTLTLALMKGVDIVLPEKEAKAPKTDDEETEDEEE